MRIDSLQLLSCKQQQLILDNHTEHEFIKRTLRMRLSIKLPGMMYNTKQKRPDEKTIHFSVAPNPRACPPCHFREQTATLPLLLAREGLQLDPPSSSCALPNLVCWWNLGHISMFSSEEGSFSELRLGEVVSVRLETCQLIPRVFKGAGQPENTTNANRTGL